jgi:SpoVK/Ycf46/Vps4 family AAA+-type ATPase
MSDPSLGRALESLPAIAVDNVDLIAERVAQDQIVTIHRFATMKSAYSIEVQAQKRRLHDVARFCLYGKFAFPETTDVSSIRALQASYLQDIRGLNLGEFGISPTYENGNKKSLKLAFDDGETSLTTWYEPGAKPPYLIHLSNDRRDGQSNMVTSLPPKFEKETIETHIVNYMKALSIIDKVMGGSGTDFAVSFLEQRPHARRERGKQPGAREQKAKAEVSTNKARERALEEAAALDDKYRPNLPNPNAKLADVHGIDADSRHKINQRITTFKHPKLAKQWGVESSGGILFYGPAGTGKTMSATAISNEIGGRLWIIDGPDIINRFVGESSANVENIFDEAVKVSNLGPLVLMFDELDAIIMNDPSQSSERTAAQGLFKRRLEQVASSEPNILVLATTNHPDRIDKALKRPGRFDLQVYMPEPDDAARRDILLHFISMDEVQGERMFDDTVNFSFDRLVELTRGMTGAEISQIIKSCKLAKFNEHAQTNMHPGPINQRDIAEAISAFQEQSKEF